MEDGGVLVWGPELRSQGGRRGGGRGRGGSSGGSVRENAHNCYNTFTRSLQNCYDFPRLRSVYSSACPDGDLMIGLARELLRAILASLFPHEDLSSCYYGNTINCQERLQPQSGLCGAVSHAALWGAVVGRPRRAAGLGVPAVMDTPPKIPFS